MVLRSLCSPSSSYSTSLRWPGQHLTSKSIKQAVKKWKWHFEIYCIAKNTSPKVSLTAECVRFLSAPKTILLDAKSCWGVASLATMSGETEQLSHWQNRSQICFSSNRSTHQPILIHFGQAGEPPWTLSPWNHLALCCWSPWPSPIHQHPQSNTQWHHQLLSY